MTINEPRQTLWELAERGEELSGPVVPVTPDLVEDLIRLGAYVHPLFTDPAHARASGFPGVPLPGQAVLLLLGGMTEQLAPFGTSVIALLGLDEVRFSAPVTAGDELALHVTLVEARPTRTPGRGVVTARMAGRVGGTEAASAVARFLVHVENAPPEGG